MKKKKSVILVATIILIAAVVAMIILGFKLIKKPKENTPEVYTGEIIQVLNGGYKIEADNIKGNDIFVDVTVDHEILEFKENEYVKVTGKQIRGKNFTVKADEVIKTSYIEEYSPTIESKEFGDIEAQYGYSISLDKIELSKTETRVYITVLNMGDSKIDLLVEESIITQDEEEYRYQDNIKAKYPKIEAQLSSSSESKGVITFPKLEKGIMNLKFKITSDNEDEKIEYYVFDVGI